MLFIALVRMPQSTMMLFSDSTPTKVIVIDTAKNTKNEIAPDPETERIHVQLVMMFGAVAGAFGTMGLFLVGSSLSLLTQSPHRRAFMDFVSARSQIGSVTTPSPPRNLST